MHKLMVGFAAAVLVGVLSAPAEAGLISIQVSSSSACGGACVLSGTLSAVGNGLTYVATYGDLSLTVSAHSNNPGDSLAGQLSQTDIAAHSTNGTAQDVTVQISQADFLSPTGDALLQSAISGTGFSPSSTSSATLISAYDAGNGLFVYPALTTTPSLVCTINVSTLNCLPSTMTSISVTSTPSYSLTNEFAINLAAGSSTTVALTGTTTLLAVPDGGMTVSLLGMAMAGLGFISRRKK
jgi:hypothetical protein